MAFTETDFQFEGIKVHCWEAGAGFPVLMIHGSGPGASTLGNWRAVMGPLAEEFHIFAMDLIGFGLSARKAQPPYFDMALWQRQCAAMIARMPGKSVGVIGHSLSGALALKLAASEARVGKVLTTATMGARFTPNDSTISTWSFPADRAALRRAAERLIHNHALIDEAYLANREKVLFQGDYADYFSSMFGGDKQKFIDAAVLSVDELARIRCGLTMLHGRNDPGFPAEPLTLTLARSLPQADVMLIGNCSHSIAMEHPDKLLAAARLLFPTKE
jgi:2-hydroxymuconate-semialdehyde hydrolase